MSCSGAWNMWYRNAPVCLCVPARRRMTWSSSGSSEKCGILLAHSTKVKSCLSAAWQMLVTGSLVWGGTRRKNVKTQVSECAAQLLHWHLNLSDLQSVSKCSCGCFWVIVNQQFPLETCESFSASFKFTRAKRQIGYKIRTGLQYSAMWLKHWDFLDKMSPEFQIMGFGWWDLLRAVLA